MLPVSDAVALSTKVDGTLVIVSVKKIKRKELRRALELLGQVDAVVLGTVLNRAGGNEGYDTYGYGYRPYAPATSEGKEGNGKRSRRLVKRSGR